VTKQGGRPGHLSYIPALDGLRAFAVAAVLLYHGGVAWTDGGFLGVDAFFVLSGFLITSLLLAEWTATGTIALGSFWARRARRLLPALFLVLGAVALYAAYVAEPVELDRLRKDGLASLAYVANWRFVFAHESYFEQFAAPSPLRHVWSLAIEEQFYLVWPLIVVGVVRVRRSTVALLGVTVAGALASVGLMAVLHEPGRDPSRVYYGTDTRAQSLLVGALVAIVLARHGPVRSAAARRALGIAGWAGAAVTLALWYATSDAADAMYRGGYLVASLGVAVVIAAVVTPGSAPLLADGLAWAPLRWIGRVSYGLYLWHWPVYVVLTGERTNLSGARLLSTRIAVTTVLATLSFYLVEQPIRRGALSTTRLRVLTPAAAVGLAGALVLVTAGASTPVTTVTAPAPPPPPPSVAPGEPESAAPTRVLVLGDSVSISIGFGLHRRQLAGSPVVVDTKGALGCGISRAGQPYERGELQPARSACADWPGAWTRAVEQFAPDVVVVLLGVWDLQDRRVDSGWLRLGTPEHDEYFVGELVTAIDVLGASGAPVVFLTTPYFKYPEEVSEPGRTFDENQPWRIDRLNSLYRQAVLARPGSAAVLDLNTMVNGGDTYRDSIDGVRLRDDGVHFSPAGADLIAEWLLPQLVQVHHEGITRPVTTNAGVGAS